MLAEEPGLERPAVSGRFRDGHLGRSSWTVEELCRLVRRHSINTLGDVPRLPNSSPHGRSGDGDIRLMPHMRTVEINQKRNSNTKTPDHIVPRG